MARRHALLIVIPAIIVVVASAIAIKQLPDLYESSARVTIEPAAGGAAPLDPSRRLSALRQQITNRARLEELISKHNLYSALKNSGASADEIVNRMRSDIRIEADSNDAGPAYGFKISYRAKDAVTADTSRAQQLLVEGYRDKLYALQQQMADVDQRLAEQRRIVEQQKKGGGIAANRFLPPDEGLLSKILLSVVNTLNVETALKLADGLNPPPAVVFEVIGKKEVDELLRKFYCNHDSSSRVM